LISEPTRGANLGVKFNYYWENFTLFKMDKFGFNTLSVVMMFAVAR